MAEVLFVLGELLGVIVAHEAGDGCAGAGLGTRIVSEGIAAAQRIFGAETIKLEAQVYARGLYEKCGFAQSSGEFLEDGIPHIEMTWTRKN